MPPVSGEQVVAPGAGQQHLDSVPAGQLADVEDIQRGRVCQRLVQLPHHPFQILSHAAGIHRYDIEGDAEVPGHPSGVGEIVGKTAVLSAHGLDGKAADVGHLLPGKRDDGAGVQSARQEGADGHVGDELLLHRPPQVINRSRNRFGITQRGARRVEEGQLIPGPAPLDSPRTDPERLPGTQFAHVPQQGPFAGTVEEREVAVQGQRIELACLGRQPEQGLDLAGKCESPTGQSVVERLDPHSITRHEQGSIPPIPQSESEDAVEPAQHRLALPQVEMQQDFGVRVATEADAAVDQVGAQLAIVIDLAVEDHDDGAIRAGHGLSARGGQIDDGQTAMDEADTLIIHVDATSIRTAMRDELPGLLKHLVGERAGEAGDAAHGYAHTARRRMSSCFRGRVGQVIMRAPAYSPPPGRAAAPATVVGIACTPGARLVRSSSSGGPADCP